MSRLIRSTLNYSKSVSYETLLNIADIQSRSSSTVLDGLSLMVGGRVRDAVAHGGWTEGEATVNIKHFRC